MQHATSFTQFLKRFEDSTGHVQYRDGDTKLMACKQCLNIHQTMKDTAAHARFRDIVTKHMPGNQLLNTHHTMKDSAVHAQYRDVVTNHVAGILFLTSPETIEDTAAHVHTMTVLPSLRPRVCITKPELVSRALKAMPTGTHRLLPALCASKKPVRQAAADNPKQAPA